MEHAVLLVITSEFLEICSQIIRADHSVVEWAAIESDDMFQSTHFCGGFDADELAFCFSYTDENQAEFWFQLTLEEIEAVFKGSITNPYPLRLDSIPDRFHIRQTNRHTIPRHCRAFGTGLIGLLNGGGSEIRLVSSGGR